MIKGNIPRQPKRFYCKVCLRKRGEIIFMEDLGNGQIRCPVCGRRTVTPSQRTTHIRSVDLVKFRTRRHGMGMGVGGAQGGGAQPEEQVWQPRGWKKEKTSKTRQFLKPEIPEPEVEIVDMKNELWIVVTLPSHNDLSEIEYEIKEGTIVLKSLITDWNKEVPLAGNLSLSEKTFKNGVLALKFKK